MLRTTVLTSLAATLLVPTAVSAASITGWNTDNVSVPAENPPDDITGESVIFDGDPTASGAVTNGKIVYTPPEGVLPGITVENEAFTFGPASATATGCIRASAPTTCDGPRQSGKRFKQVATGFGPIDLVFDVDPDGTQDAEGNVDVGYRVFHRLINGTGARAEGFTVSLGFGVGSDFEKSGEGDGLGFSTVAAFRDPVAATTPPDTVSSATNYPFGLFGDADTNPNFDLGGFFDTTMRSGFDLEQTEDMLTSAGFYGVYDDLFGSWLPQSLVPEGALWDNDGDDSTDALVMAWFNEAIDQWEVRREVDPEDSSKAISLEESEFFDDIAGVRGFLGLDEEALFEDLIEDLANLNLNYGIVLDDRFAGESFTLRVSVTPVPLPLALPLFATALAGLGLLKRRRAA